MKTHGIWFVVLAALALTLLAAACAGPALAQETPAPPADAPAPAPETPPANGEPEPAGRSAVSEPPVAQPTQAEPAPMVEPAQEAAPAPAPESAVSAAPVESVVPTEAPAVEATAAGETPPVPQGVPGTFYERPPTEAEAVSTDGRIAFNFSNASLDSVLSGIVKAAGLKFLKTSTLTGSVTISNLEPVTVDQALDIVDTILHTQGSALVRQGDILTVVPLDAAKTLATPVFQGTAQLSDADLPAGAEIVTWVQPLGSADATKVAKDLAPLVAKTGLLAANQSSNALIISDTGSNVQRILRIVRQLDVPQLSVSSVKIFRLENAVASSLVAPLTTLFGQSQSEQERMAQMRMMMAGRQPGAEVPSLEPRVKVQITADDRTNSLIIAAQEKELELISEVVAELDAQPKGTVFDVKILTLRYADANDVANVIRQIFVDQSRAAQNRGGQQQMDGQRMRIAGGSEAAARREEVRVAANVDTNSVVVAATTENLDLISKMVAEIDDVAAGSPQTIGIFHLENADGAELTDTLRTIMGLQAQTSRGGTSRATNVRQQTTNRATNRTNANTQNTNAPGRPSNTRQTSPTGGRSGTTGTGGSRSTGTGTRGSMLDAGEILVWPPRAVAQDAAASDAGAPLPSVRPGLGMEVRRASQIPETELPASEYAEEPVAQEDAEDEEARQADEAVAAQEAAIRRKPIARNADIVITYDDRTGTVIVSAPEDTLALMRSVIEELDRDPVEKYTSRVYHLNNADATNIAAVMNSIFAGTTAGGEGIAQELRGAVSVVPDTSSNSLIITSAPRNFDPIYQLVKDLDQAPPQVMIQAVLVEVSLNDESKIGMVNTRLDFNEVLPFREYGFGDSTLFWSVIDEKVDGFIDLLETHGSVEVLSRPQILASDNKPAQINVGQSVPFVTRVQTTESGNTINTIQYQDIGILLDVTPHINPEGYVNMDIAPEISNFSDSTVSVGENIQASVFTKRSAYSTVAIQDGQTIVIGGLMTNEDRKTVRSIPVVSKIPLIGPILFQHTQTAKVKTDLLIIITPKVVRTPEAALQLSAEERIRSESSSRGKTEGQIGSIQLNEPPLDENGYITLPSLDLSGGPWAVTGEVIAPSDVPLLTLDAPVTVVPAPPAPAAGEEAPNSP